ncbi:hypothetical protein SAMN05216188_10716 [Lentzea xinjiangensis]|uniref:SnoaL-like domain-containing protein n=1 Tax=Lentzea xinjiangensis TaxID=402600 RepID=A0A1H9KL52_9PSEU|nr:nuclear transport factor 2 family protein [Lentzea xinjiangensis]SEQ99828.1 hypothetical protein SAMN05216188_10716 [Lentzea xinjiangensis]
MNRPANDPRRRNFLKVLGGAGLSAPFLAVTPAAAQGTGTSAATSAREKRITRLTLAAFERQATGGSFFDVLAEDVTWTIAAAEPGVHRGKRAFLANGVRAVTGRLSTAIVPEIRGTWAQHDTVVVHWYGTAVARDGLPYRNNYCWIWQYRGDEVVNAVAFLDLVALTELFERVPLDGAAG